MRFSEEISGSEVNDALPWPTDPPAGMTVGTRETDLGVFDQDRAPAPAPVALRTTTEQIQRELQKAYTGAGEFEQILAMQDALSPAARLFFETLLDVIDRQGRALALLAGLKVEEAR